MNKRLLVLSWLLGLCVAMAAEKTVFESTLCGEKGSLQTAGWEVPGKGITEGPNGVEVLATGGQRNMLRYSLPVKVGNVYGGSLEVRTEGMQLRANSDRGATLFFGFLDKDKKWVNGGEFPRGPMGDSDWRKVEISMTRPIPWNVAFIEIWLCTEGQGKAQYRNLEVHEVDLSSSWAVVDGTNPPVFTFDSPSFTRGGRIENRLRIEVSQDVAFPPEATFAEMVSTKGRFEFPYALAPGKWYAKSFWCGRGRYADMKAEFTVAEAPAGAPLRFTPTFANGRFAALPELTFDVYPRMPAACTATVDGKPLVLKANGEGKLTFVPAAPLAAGTYDIVIEADGHQSKYLLVNKDPAHKYEFRDDHMMLLDGKPFFPIGTYRDPSDELTNFEGIEEAGFNVTHSYAFEGTDKKGEDMVRYLQDCQRHGVYAFMGIPRPHLIADRHYELQKHCAAMYDQAGLLSFYLADEPELWINCYSMKNGADAVGAACPGVPRILLLCSATDTRPDILYLSNGLSEIMWHDPYPIPRTSITDVRTTLETMRRACKDQQALWCVVQAFDWKQQSVRGLPYEEVEPKAGKIRCMTHLALAANVQGIIYYWLPHDRYDMRRDSPIQWAETVACARELRTLYPFLIGRNVPQKLALPEGVDSWCRQAADGRKAVGLINTTEKPIEVEAEILGKTQKIKLRPWGVEVLKQSAAAK